MVAGETLLKLNDFPFIYSLLAILFISGGMDIGQIATDDNKSQFPFMFFALSGFIASSFAITDPGGKLIRWGRKNAIKRSQKNDESKKYEISALSTRSIDIEIEKLVSIFYLIFILFTFLGALTFSPNFVKHLTIEGEGSVICNENCVSTLGYVVAPAIMIILLIEMASKIQELSKNIETAGFYRYAMDIKTATTQSKDNLNRAIEQNNWGLADWWKLQIEKEIEVEEGLEEQRQRIQIETLEKQLMVYGELLTILAMGRMIATNDSVCMQTKTTHIFSVPDDENRFRGIFAKGRYLFTQQLNDDYTDYEKNKKILTSRSNVDSSAKNSYSDLTKMEKTTEDEYQKLKNAYQELTDLQI